jgi:hypothetical protein
LDPDQSSITISGNLVGNSIKEQGSGSLTTKYKGAISVNRDGNQILFPGGSLVVAENNGNWQPLTNGVSGSAAANYGAAVESILGSGQTAIRNIQLDLVSSALEISNNEFSTLGLAFQFLTNASSSMDYTIKSLFMTESGSFPLAGFSTNQISDKATLKIEGNEEILIIPINASMSFKVLVADDSRFDFKGKFVAKRSLASTASFSILGIGRNDQDFIIQWETVSGQKYQVFGSENLISWSSCSDVITASGSITSISLPISGSGQFFRILKQ